MLILFSPAVIVLSVDPLEKRGTRLETLALKFLLMDRAVTKVAATVSCTTN